MNDNEELHMKRVLKVILSLCFVIVMAGCESKSVININVENSSELSGITMGTDSLIEIGSNLWYDTTTRIVYWWSGNINPINYGATTPTPYYAPNGLPYKYNPETNTFEEIVDE